MRGPVGIDMQEWGAGPWLPELELEFGEAQGAGWTRECTAGPQKVTQDPPFMDGETGLWFGCVDHVFHLLRSDASTLLTLGRLPLPGLVGS